MIEIAEQLNVRPDMLTYTQFYLGLESLGERQLRGLKERAIAARVAMADKHGWKDFMNRLDSGADYSSDGPTVEQMLAGGPPADIDEGEMERIESWPK
jgi:hypothetical protein